MKEKEKKLRRILRIFMTLLTCILIALFFGIMVLVSDMQGTARVVNYAGLVRGKTQQIIKLENAKEPQDEMIRKVDTYIDGLRHGSDELNLIRLDDKAFQDKMEVQEQFFEQLKEEIYKAREEGYENTQIINKSETFFTICDETTGLAESYSQKLASLLNRLEKIVVVDIIGIVCLFGYELFKALRYAAQNRVLRQKVYLDEATGLPNKNKCEEILGSVEPLTDREPTAVMVFDLNNLRVINNRQGHERGDQYIRSFAEQLRAALPEKYFVGRDGGDEFIAVLKQVDHEQVKDCLQMTTYIMNEIKVNEHILDDDKYLLIFSVEEVNRLAREGMPFRDAYKKVGLDIEAGNFSHSKEVHHTHEGSIGNLCNDEVSALMQKVVDGFNFETMQAAEKELLGR